MKTIEMYHRIKELWVSNKNLEILIDKLKKYLTK